MTVLGAKAVKISWAKRWRKFVEAFAGRKGYQNVLKGLGVTARIALFGFLIGLVIGSIVAIVNIASRRNKVAKGFNVVGNIYINVFRGTPILVQLMLAHFAVFPMMNLDMGELMEAILVFGLNSGAYVSEVMRAGILSVDIGQLEAGRAVGLSYTRTMTRIVLPQAMKNSLPSLGNELIALVKDTSVASMVAVVDLTTAFTMVGGEAYDYFVPYLFLALFYLVIVLILTFIIKLVERRLRKSERH